ncbi:MAG: malate dehydrogenase [Campylobacteraceae bacterium]|nr:malate dehydrogenase [Campylobacteraceae bacterium]
MVKIGIVGAGNVGASLAYALIQEQGLKEIVIYDLFSQIAEGKTLDLMQASVAAQSSTELLFAKDLSQMAGADLVIITAGVARKPGMSRQDLLFKNASIIKDTAIKISYFAPNAYIVVVSNPLDVMTYVAWKASGFSKNRVIGMAGVLDSARLAYHLSMMTKEPFSKIKALVIGEHGPDMLPLLRISTVNGKAVQEILSSKERDEVIIKTRDSGACIVELLGTSAFYAPAMSTKCMVKALLDGSKEIMSASVVLDGEYGKTNIACGVPIRLGRDGVEEIIVLELTKEELRLFNKGCENISLSIEELRKKSII